MIMLMRADLVLLIMSSSYSSNSFYDRCRRDDNSFNSCLSLFNEASRYGLVFPCISGITRSPSLNTAIIHIELMLLPTSRSWISGLLCCTRIVIGPARLLLLPSAARRETLRDKLISALSVCVLVVVVRNFWVTNGLLHHSRDWVCTEWRRWPGLPRVVVNLLPWEISSCWEYTVVSATTTTSVTSILCWIATISTIWCPWEWLESRSWPTSSSRFGCVEP